MDKGAEEQPGRSWRKKTNRPTKMLPTKQKPQGVTQQKEELSLIQIHRAEQTAGEDLSVQTEKQQTHRKSTMGRP